MSQQKTMATCPECGAKVRKDNLKGHVNKIHRTTEERREQEPAKPIHRTTKKARKVSPWPAVAMAVVLGLSAVGVYAYLAWFSGSPNSVGPPSAGNPTVTMSVTHGGTPLGAITLELFRDKAPTTVNNFVALAKQGFYDGLWFWRVDPGFVIQGGSPTNDQTGVSSNTIPWENSGLKNTHYSIAMARGSSPDSASCQFFINLDDNTQLDTPPYPYVVFGHVRVGLSVVDAIGAVPTVLDGQFHKPVTPVVMTSVTVSP